MPPDDPGGIGQCTWQMDAVITTAGTWNAITPLGNADILQYDPAGGWAGFKASTAVVAQSWVLSANFILPGPGQPAFAPFEILQNPIMGPNDPYWGKVKETDYWGDKPTNIPGMGFLSDTDDADPNHKMCNRVYHGGNNAATGSMLMKLWYMTNPWHHITDATHGGAQNFDQPLINVASGTVDITAQGIGCKVVWFPERGPNFNNGANPYALTDVVSTVLMPGQTVQHDLKANVGYYSQKAIHHYSNEAGQLGADPTVCADWGAGCNANFGAADCGTQLWLSPALGGGAFGTYLSQHVAPSYNYLGHEPWDYYGKYGHRAFAHHTVDALAAPPFNTAVACAPSAQARGDILAVICLDDHDTLEQVQEMGF